MKTKDYVRLFKLDKPFYEFSREKFLNELGREFNQRVEDTRLERQRRNLEFTFSIFNKIVKEIEIKFWSISNKKHGLPFSEKLFSSFFAGWDNPNPKKIFPKRGPGINLKMGKEKIGNAKIRRAQKIQW